MVNIDLLTKEYRQVVEYGKGNEMDEEHVAQAVAHKTIRGFEKMASDVGLPGDFDENIDVLKYYVDDAIVYLFAGRFNFSQNIDRKEVTRITREIINQYAIDSLT